MNNKDQVLLEEAYTLILEKNRIKLLEEGIFQDVFNKVKDKFLKFGRSFPKKLATVYSRIKSDPELQKVIMVTALGTPLTLMAHGLIPGMHDLKIEIDLNTIVDTINSIYNLIAGNTLDSSTLQDILDKVVPLSPEQMAQQTSAAFNPELGDADHIGGLDVPRH